MDIVISIHPEYVDKIRKNLKKIELRKSFPINKNIKKVWVYETRPTSKIVGYFEPDGHIIQKPELLWEKYSSLLGIDREKYDKYFNGREIAIGIKIKEWIELPESEKKAISYPPQNYCFII